LGVGEARLATEALSAELDATWTRTGSERSIAFWRQFLCVVEPAIEIDRSEWLDLFPGLEVPHAERFHGFPFIAKELPPDVYGIGPSGWSGVIPSAKNERPSYAWLLKRTAQFMYRERAWEEDPLSVTRGHVHVGAMLELALGGTFFMTRVVDRWKVDEGAKVELRMDLHGMSGRGVVAGGEDPRGMLVDTPTRVSSDNHLTASMARPVGELVEDPVRVGLELVSELVMPLRPDLARDAALTTQLNRRLAHDRRWSDFRSLGFLDKFKPRPK
jgi:hypothetical protein